MMTKRPTSVVQSDNLDGSVTVEKVRRAISLMKAVKSPAMDVFPSEYY